MPHCGYAGYFPGYLSKIEVWSGELKVQQIEILKVNQPESTLGGMTEFSFSIPNVQFEWY